jgi:hypothetical protein
MTPLVVLLPLLIGQAETPPPATSSPPMLRMEGTTTAPTAQPAPAPAQAPDVPARGQAPAEPVPSARGAPVFLTINSNRKDLLLIRADNDETACTVPCDKLVPAGPKDEYFLGGKGITNSNNFDLADGIKGARIDVRAGSKAGKIAGIILTAIGAPMLLSGGLNMVSWGILQDPAIQAQIAQSGQQSFISPTVTLVIALIELAVGAGAFTTGVILWPMNTTTMTVKPMEPPVPVSAPEPPAPPAEQVPSN